MNHPDTGFGGFAGGFLSDSTTASWNNCSPQCSIGAMAKETLPSIDMVAVSTGPTASMQLGMEFQLPNDIQGIVTTRLGRCASAVRDLTLSIDTTIARWQSEQVLEQGGILMSLKDVTEAIRSHCHDANGEISSFSPFQNEDARQWGASHWQENMSNPKRHCTGGYADESLHGRGMNNGFEGNGNSILQDGLQRQKDLEEMQRLMWL